MALNLASQALYLRTAQGNEPRLRSWMALWATKLLKYATNSGAVVITGKRMSSVTGYGEELLCEYTILGDGFSLVSLDIYTAYYIIMYAERYFGSLLKKLSRSSVNCLILIVDCYETSVVCPLKRD